ncbi:MAG: RsbRD N-terminal domain-containing protein [Desulfamplus sp.]|nr:RsbRD N-terminal domain-containing protein [Desulfamplus sp.]
MPNQLIDLNRQLELNKEKILTLWFEAAISSYPEDTARLLGKSKNRFDNPVGNITRQSLEDTFDNIIRMSLAENYKDYTNSKHSQTNKEHVGQNRVENSLDPVIRIRAVQNFSASQAVAFVFELKAIVKSVLGKLPDESFNYRVDLVALAAFNRFMKCRENIFLLKATEAKRRVHSAFERAGLVTELTEDELLGSSKS